MKEWWERIGPDWRILLMFLAGTVGPWTVAALAFVVAWLALT